MSKPDPCILVIFGASGDLTQRKLVPSLYKLQQQNLLPESFAVLGIGRTQLTDESFREKMSETLEGDASSFIAKLHYLKLATSVARDYLNLVHRLRNLDSEYHAKHNIIFYLATPPSLYEIIPKYLALHKLNDESLGWRRLIIEKPFGYDLQSAQKLNESIFKDWHERQLYRIDHYLGKETVQNLLVFRFANQIFEPLWNHNYIDYVEVTSAELIGVEKRGGYYDKSGAMRDMVQNHLLQLLGMVAMEPPARFDAVSVRNETIKVMHSLRPISDFDDSVVMGQYTSSTIKGEVSQGYRAEIGVPEDSRTETFVALKAYIDNSRWHDVPFYIRTGKRLPARVSEVVLHFKRTPHPLFGTFSSNPVEHNQLIIRIQPDEGILLKFGLKVPGGGFEAKSVKMDFHYSDLTGTKVPDAYERLLLDSMLGDATLYARGDAVEACWDFVDPILKHFAKKDSALHGYPCGTWGPQAADELLAKQNHVWRRPCKNLNTDGDFCEL
jgi:glucose-6-phosphate 1-dehydrogenase